MLSATRRLLVTSLPVGLAATVARLARAAPASDGHAFGYDVAAAPDPVALIPRRAGEPTVFTVSLDQAPLKATSGGWAREVTTRTLPIATGLAAAHLFVNPGGAREMHWHNSDEWAYVLGGHAQITAQDPAGEIEVVNVSPGDLWYFPRGHAHAIHTLGETPLNALLVFNDGLYAEHGTFGISDWMSRIDARLLTQALGLASDGTDKLPQGETYIMQGPVIPQDSPEAHSEQRWPAERSHRYTLLENGVGTVSPGGPIYGATQAQFPIPARAGLLVRMQPGAMQQIQWHPNANELHYVASGRVRMTMFAVDKRMSIADLGPGDCAYVPANCGHTLQNIGDVGSDVISVLDSPDYQEATLLDWLRKAPPHLLRNNLGIDRLASPVVPDGDLVGRR